MMNYPNAVRDDSDETECVSEFVYLFCLAEARHGSSRKASIRPNAPIVNPTTFAGSDALVK